MKTKQSKVLRKSLILTNTFTIKVIFQIKNLMMMLTKTVTMMKVSVVSTYNVQPLLVKHVPPQPS